MATPEPAYKAISAAKRAERDSKIPAEWRITLPADDDNLMDLPRTCGIFSARELEITETPDAVALLEQIHAGAYSAVEVARAFCKRAAVAQQALNCLTEIFFEDAYSRAAHLDAEFARTGKPVGPLHGLPVSLKDSINPWLQDPSCAYLPWEPPADIPGRPLVLGVIRDDHETTPLPPVARVLDETIAALRAAGHEVLDLGPFPYSAELSANAVAHFKIDGGAALAATMALTDEPYTPSVLAGGLYPCPAQPLPKLYEYAAERARLQHAWLRLWASTSSRSASGRPLDAILCPVQGSVPRPHETLLRSHFTRNWNVLDYPAAVVQCGTCRMARDDVPLPMPPPSEAMERVYEIYSEEKRGRYEGFPLALQVVGQRQQEARLLAVCKVVDELVHR